ncbi:pseudouridine synthase [Verrucomicrobiota bacterium]
MKKSRFKVRQEELRTSLRDFVAARMGLSKRKAKELLDTRGVFVNGKRVWMARHSLAPGDVVEISGDPVRLRRSADVIEVLHEDPDYIVVDKPAGMLSNGEDSVEEFLRSERGEELLSAAHRLDLDTTGCLLLARSSSALEEAVKLFRKRCVQKTYHAIAAGRVAPPVREISTPLRGHPATTRLRTLDANSSATHLTVRIKTGRTHQIRKHLASIHNPVLGDRHYGTGERLSPKHMAVGRQMLHASSLEFEHPRTGKKIRAKARLPRDFRRCLKAFRLS